MNTNSVSDSLSHIFTVPKSPLVWCLVFTWVLSPLGGQGSLRLIHRSNSDIKDIHELRYWDAGPLGNLYAYNWVWPSNDGGYALSTRDIYLAGLMQSAKAKTGPLDQFGNVKIPRLPNANTSDEDADGWFSTARGNIRPEEYSSLLGIPIIGLSGLSAAKVEFTIETSYVDVSCPKMEFISNVRPPRGMNITCLDCSRGKPGDGSDLYTARLKSFLGSPFPELTAAQKLNASYTQPKRIQFNSAVLNGGYPSGGTSQATCTITQRLVEVFIECIKGDCAATKIRPSRADHRGANFTNFDFWASVVLDMITQTSQDKARGSQVTLGASTSELFLENSNAVPLQQAQVLFSLGDVVTNLSTVSADLFSARASVLLNTGLQTFMCPTGFAGNFSTNLTLYGPDHTPTDGLSTIFNKSSLSIVQILDGGFAELGNTVIFIAASTNATVTRQIEVYLPTDKYLWVVVLVISATFLFLMGLIGLCLRFGTMAPNVFDPVMGLTYDNKYMPSASQESPLDAEDRFKVLANERIRLGYVESNDMIAKVVFGEEAHVSPLSKKMRYY